MGDVTVYIVDTPARPRDRGAARRTPRAGRAKFFEVGDAVEMSWRADAGHFIED